MAGVLYLHSTFHLNTFDDLNFPYATLGLPAPNFVGFVDQFYRQNVDTASAFLQGTYSITDSFKITGGVRYSYEDKEATLQRNAPMNVLASIFPPFPETTLDVSKGFFDGSIGVEYAVGEGKLLYASFSRGTKPGGFGNAAPTDAASAEYLSEETLNTEVGAKLGFGGGNYLNLAFFNVQSNNFQFSEFNGVNFVFRNTDLASRGVEVTGAVEPFEQLRFVSSVTYADVFDRQTKADQIQAPKWVGNIRSIFTQPIGDDFELSAEVGARFRSEMLLKNEPSPVPLSDGYVMLDARIAIADIGDRWELSAFGRNLTDKRIGAFGFPTPFVSGSVTLAAEQTRTIGVQLSVTY
ncbi:TonB-dependent receptor domain-containing protein [Hyphococcus sp.]|uniref:TonB-dependent receptor domain-containing protein n=1 Tax=Hyphococcus sp. TaxID=2038636 RepID=UPI0035C68FD4